MILDVDAFALENAYESVYPSAQTDTVLFMNIGASFTNMSIVEKGISRVVRDVFISGNTLTKAIQQQFQCDVKTAEQKKITHGLRKIRRDPEAQQVNEVLLPIARDLLAEVQRSIDFYLSQGSDRSVSKIFLCGGSANLKSLDQFLSNELKIPVEIFNPLALLQNAPTDLSEEQKSLLPQMAVAIGLATRREGDRSYDSDQPSSRGNGLRPHTDQSGDSDRRRRDFAGSYSDTHSPQSNGHPRNGFRRKPLRSKANWNAINRSSRRWKRSKPRKSSSRSAKALSSNLKLNVCATPISG